MRSPLVSRSVEWRKRSVVKSGCEFANLNYHLHGFFHYLYAHKLVWPVEIHSSGKDVGAGQTFETLLWAVGAASDWLHLWGHSSFLHGSQHEIYNMHVGINFLLHVIILVIDISGHGALAVFLVHLLGACHDKRFAVFKSVSVVAESL